MIDIAFREQSYSEAVKWYEKAVNTISEDENGEFDATMDDPVYQLKAAMAKLYLSGGYGLDKDPSYAGTGDIKDVCWFGRARVILA